MADNSPVQRRLAAVLAADIAGYSRARLKALRAELIDPAIAELRGRIVKTTGDGSSPAMTPVFCRMPPSRLPISARTSAP